MIPIKTLLSVTIFGIASLQYVSSFACPQIPNCQTPEMCFAFDDDPSVMVWGPCEGCPDGQGTCLYKSSANECVSASSGCSGMWTYTIPNCSSATKTANGIAINHICGAFPCCGITWSGKVEPRPKRHR